MTESELQGVLLRFESQFGAGVENANRVLESSPNLGLRYVAGRNRLVYATNSLEIVTGASPEANLLDMITFVELSRDALEKYWIPKVFHAQGKALADTFRESSDHLWKIAAKVLTSQQSQALKKYISKWRSLHPDQVNVESVRLAVFANDASLSAEEQSDVGGLFASVQQASESADAARLFAARALYYAERAPTLLRLQGKLLAREIMYEIGTSLTQAKGPALRQLGGIAGEVEQRGNQFLLKLAGVGAALIVFFWIVALIAKLTYLRLARRFEAPEARDAEHREAA